MTDRRSERGATRVAGWCCIVLALLTLGAAWQTTPVGALLVALVLGLLGVEALVSAARDRPSLLSRIGPLP